MSDNKHVNPQPKELWWIKDQEDPKASEVIAFVLRRATLEDKEEFFRKVQENGVRPNQRFMEQWFADPNIFSVLLDELIICCHLKSFVKPFTEDTVPEK